MADYRKRFTREDLRNELVEHFKAMPADQTEAAIHRAADAKSKKYEEALAHLDRALDHFRRAAEQSGDTNVKAAHEVAAREVKEAIDAYGEAALVVNASWGDDPT